LEETAKFLGDSYEIGLLWKTDDVNLPDNRNVAVRRLKLFEDRLNKDYKLKSAVKEKIDSHIQKGYLRKVSEKELSEFPNGRRWYLPIFCVVNPNKPEKPRIVFDAASKCQGISLNDTLLPGPDLLTSLFGVLLKFRRGQIGFTADIAEMFHRIKILKRDQSSQMLLWRDCNPEIEISTYAMTVMTFGATCSPSSAQYIKNIHALKYKDQFSIAYESITRHFYVDDLLESTNSVSDAISLARDVKKILGDAGFDLRNWISNNKELALTMNGPGVGNGLINMDRSQLVEVEKILGLFWCVKTDEFMFRLSFNRVDQDLIKLARYPTKREALRIIMSIFDPLGFLVPQIIPAKVLMQDIWRSGVDWDEQIPEGLFNKWSCWLGGLENIKNYRVPRCYTPGMMNPDRIEVHTFCDASELAFGSVLYLRFCFGE
jgi:hypothetical protein